MTSENSTSARDLDYATTYTFCVSAYNVGGESEQACVDATTAEALAVSA